MRSVFDVMGALRMQGQLKRETSFADVRKGRVGVMHVSACAVIATTLNITQHRSDPAASTEIVVATTMKL